MPRGHKWTPGTKRYIKATTRFIESLQMHGNVSRAAREAALKRDLVYDWKETDPVFKRSWEAALERGLDSLEDEAQRRAVTGTLRPVFQGGKKVGAVREFSDTLLIFLLNGGRPEKYKHRVDHTSAGQPLRNLTEQQVDQRLQKLLSGDAANDTAANGNGNNAGSAAPGGDTPAAAGTS